MTDRTRQTRPFVTNKNKSVFGFVALGLVHCFLATVELYGAPPALTIMAQTGSSGLLSIDPNVAINREGIIAFTGRDSTGSRVFVATGPGTITPILSAVSGRTNAGVGITSGS